MPLAVMDTAGHGALRMTRSRTPASAGSCSCSGAALLLVRRQRGPQQRQRLRQYIALRQPLCLPPLRPRMALRQQAHHMFSKSMRQARMALPQALHGGLDTRFKACMRQLLKIRHCIRWGTHPPGRTCRRRHACP